MRTGLFRGRELTRNSQSAGDWFYSNLSLACFSEAEFFGTGLGEIDNPPVFLTEAARVSAGNLQRTAVFDVRDLQACILKPIETSGHRRVVLVEHLSCGRLFPVKPGTIPRGLTD